MANMKDYENSALDKKADKKYGEGTVADKAYDKKVVASGSKSAPAWHGFAKKK